MDRRMIYNQVAKASREKLISIVTDIMTWYDDADSGNIFRIMDAASSDLGLTVLKANETDTEVTR